MNTLIFILSIIEAVFISSLLILTFDLHGKIYIGWAIAVGVTVGLVNWLAPKLTWATIWLGPIYSLIMLAVVAVLVMCFYWFHDQIFTTALRQLFVMLLIMIPVTLTAKSAAWMSYYALKAKWVTSVPLIVSVIALIIMTIDALFYRE